RDRSSDSNHHIRERLAGGSCNPSLQTRFDRIAGSYLRVGRATKCENEQKVSHGCAPTEYQELWQLFRLSWLLIPKMSRQTVGVESRRIGFGILGKHGRHPCFVFGDQPVVHFGLTDP